MSERLGWLIGEKPELVPEQWVARAKQLTTGLLSDAMGCFGAMDYRIKPIAAGMKLAGTAMTVNLRAADNLMLHKAIGQCGKGYVLVADAKGNTSNACWGDLMTRAAIRMQIEGAVVDGVVRDLADLRQLGYPVFALGVVPAGVNREGPGEINVPISCGGVVVNPGDLILGDEDGVVVVPRQKIEAVLQAAEAKAAGEESRIREIGEGKIEADWLIAKSKQLGLSQD